MANIPISLSCADYSRLMPLATGEVRPDGIDLTLILGSRGSWSRRAEMLHRAINDPTLDGGEGSMAGHLRRIDQGDRSFIGLPVFLLRTFTGRDLYVRREGPVRTPGDLAGKRIGMYSWVASGSVWYRHFLRHIKVPLDSLEWWIGDVDAPTATTHDAALPASVRQVPEGRFLSDMLIKGEIDVLYCPPRPKRYDPVNGPIVRLFPDMRAVERNYFRRTGVFPPQHLIILRRASWEKNRSIAQGLTEAFIHCNEHFTLAQRLFPYASPWFEAELDETAALMGEDFHPYGLDKNRQVLEIFCDQAHRAGLTRRQVTVDELFTEFLGA
jgi:4,5-dihydroxyphthalate decarboxylase